jgi:hypothetical protein
VHEELISASLACECERLEITPRLFYPSMHG